MKKYIFSTIIIPFLAVLILSSFPIKAAIFTTGSELKSQSVKMVNLNTETVVFEKNATQKREPASLTKIMTYIIVYENIPDLNTKITVIPKVSEELANTGSSLAGIYNGEVLTAEQLLNCMMVPSGNDAALALALYVGENEESNFVALMNQKAKEIGCKNTNFMNSHGLHHENYYSTAEDFYLITKYALQIPGFLEVTSQSMYTLPPTNKSKTSRDIFTTNALITKGSSYEYEYTRGIKTGSHDQAGYCLISTAVKNGYRYMVITMGAPSIDKHKKRINLNGAFQDTIDLYTWAFKNLSTKTVVTEEDSLAEIKINFAWNKDTILLVPKKNYSTILPNDVLPSSVISKIDVPKSIDAPVKKGDMIGKATLMYAGEELITIDLVVAESVKQSKFLKLVNLIETICRSKWVRIGIAALMFLLIIYIILVVIYNRKKKKLRKIKNFRKM